MKRKTLKILCICFLCMNSSTFILAENEQDSTKEKGNTVNEEGMADYDVSGFEAWLPDVNPTLRGFESNSYYREGNFIVGTDSNGAIRSGTAIKTSGWGSNGWRVYVYTNGNWVERVYGVTVKEYTNVSGTFTLKRNRTIHTMPSHGSTYRTKEVLPAGTYQVKKASMEFVELVKPNGTTGWVCPQYEDNGYTFSTTNYGVFNGTKETLSVNSVNGISIKQKMMPVREDKRTGIAMKPKYVTIHNTANTGYGANAAAHANLQMNDARQWISWHYTVDNKEIYQSMPMNEVAYHAGDGNYIGNGATIGIEICENSDGNYAQAEKNAAYLTAQLLYENGLPSDAVRMHKDWSGKNCARNIIGGTKGTMGWNAFKALVKQEYDRLNVDNNIDSVIPEKFKEVMGKSGYTFQNGFVNGIALNSSLQSIQDKFKSLDSSINVVFKKGTTTIGTENKIATGQIATLTKGDITFRFMFVVRGDTNGDGKISSLDYAFVKNQILNVNNLTGAYSKAGDVNKDGKISSLDYAFIKNHILQIHEIKQ